MIASIFFMVCSLPRCYFKISLVGAASFVSLLSVGFL
jgi:hypothetical protein